MKSVQTFDVQFKNAKLLEETKESILSDYKMSRKYRFYRDESGSIIGVQYDYREDASILNVKNGIVESFQSQFEFTQGAATVDELGILGSRTLKYGGITDTAGRYSIAAKFVF